LLLHMFNYNKMEFTVERFFHIILTQRNRQLLLSCRPALTAHTA
jgi:hypothetical protein